MSLCLYYLVIFKNIILYLVKQGFSAETEDLNYPTQFNTSINNSSFEEAFDNIHLPPPATAKRVRYRKVCIMIRIV